MYDEKQIAALSADNFDYSNFDWRSCKSILTGAIHGVYTGFSSYDIRSIHVAYSLARKRPIVGDKGIEQPNTREPMTATRVKWAINQFKLEKEKAA